MNIDFVGGCDDNSFDKTNPNYLGEWSREQIHEHLTDYGNLVLLSNGEADPLVVKEALVSGLGVVVNMSSSGNLDTSLDFITVIEDNKMDDLVFIEEKIKENLEISIQRRNEIREYGVSQFDISQEIKRYITLIGN
jgi:glycosyltransferase involved in cell wall biosynthesis